MRSCARLIVEPKSCLECGRLLNARNGHALRRKKYCNPICQGLAATKRRLLKEPTSKSAGRWRARYLNPEGPCENCASDRNVDVHHKDGNFLNNSFGNLKRLCRSCHLKAHRPAGLRAWNKKITHNVTIDVEG